MNLEQAQEIIEQQKLVINYERSRRQWLEETLSNPDLPIQTRLAMIATRKIAETARPGEDGFFRAHLPRLADVVGVSASSMSRGLRALADSTQAIEHITKPDELEPYKQIVFIKPTPLLDQPHDLKPTKEIKHHGGDHRIARCNGCGSENIIEKRVQVCADCGTVFKEFEPHPVNTPLQDATGESAEQDSSELFVEPLQDATYTVDTLLLDFKLPPDALRSKSIWYPWRWEPHQDKQGNIVPGAKPDKVPYQVGGRDPQKAKSNDARTWSAFEQALAAYKEAIKWDFKKKYDGIGLMCDGSFVGIDLDHCRNKETGEIAPWAQAIIDRFHSHTYVTPSREGVRILIWAHKPGTRCKKGDIEIYEKGRPFAWTPEQVPGTPDEIADRQAELDAFYAEVFPEPEQTEKLATVEYLPCSLPDETILEKANRARNGAKFKRLYYDGDITGYPSESEADLALCELLSYYGGGGHVSTIDRLFRQSPLCREEKWDRAARAGETYGEGTIRRAIAMAMGERLSA